MSQNPPPPREKKTYTPPQLVQYGDISKLTAGNFSVGQDFPGMTKMTQCL